MMTKVHTALVAFFALLVATSFVACGGGGGSIAPIQNTITSVTVTASPTSIQTTQTAQCTAVVSGTGDYSSAITWSATGGAISTSGVFTPSGAGAATCKATSNQDPTKSGSANITVSAPPPTITSVGLVAAPTSITTAQTSTLTPTVAGTGSFANTVNLSVSPTTAGSLSDSTNVSSGSSVTFTPTALSATTTVTITAVSTEDSTKSATATITVTVAVAPNQKLTSVSPAVRYCLGECAFITETFTGENLIVGGKLECTPDSDIQLVQIVGTTQLNVTFAIDQVHEGPGYRSCKTCKGDGTSCSNSVAFALYSSNMCDVYQKTGEKFCLNPEETVAGQHLSQGVPLNGYVDKYTASGAPDGKFFVGAPNCCIAVDDVTGFVSVDGGISDESGGEGDVTFPQGMTSDTITAVASKAGWTCYLQPTAAKNLSCYDVTLPAASGSPVLAATIASTPQSIEIGVVGGKPYAYVLSVGSSNTLLKVDIANGMTVVDSQPISGITADAPGGTSIVLFNALGVGIVTSYGDNLTAFFSESSLKQTIEGVSLPGSPVNIVADTAAGLAIVGNADAVNSQGTFETINPTTGAVTTLTSTIPFLPTALSVASDGKSFYACPVSAAACTAITLP